MAISLEGKIFLRVLYKKFQAGYNGPRPGMGRLFLVPYSTESSIPVSQGCFCWTLQESFDTLGVPLGGMSLGFVCSIFPKFGFGNRVS